MQHLDEGTVHAWLDGALPTTEAREVEQHVADCSACADMVAEARGLVAGASRIVSSLDVARGNVIPKRPAGGAGPSLWNSLHLTPARAALAATLMIAVSTLLTVRHNTSEKLVPPPAVATGEPSTAAPTAPPAAETRSAAPAPASNAGPTAGRIVASSTPSKQTVGSPEKDRAESANKPKEEIKAKADVATDAIAEAPRVVQAPPPAAAGAAVANSLDSSLKKAVSKVADADVSRARDQVAAQRFAPAFAERAVGLSTVRCFQFTEPPPSGIPQRFALQVLAQDTTRRVLRAVNENGRLDSLLTGGTWTRATSTEITVRFASNDQPVTLAIKDAAAGLASVNDERRDPSKRAGPSVSVFSCRP